MILLLFYVISDFRIQSYLHMQNHPSKKTLLYTNEGLNVKNSTSMASTRYKRWTPVWLMCPRQTFNCVCIKV